MTGTHAETIVVGGGIAGLAYAHARGPDADLLLLERDETVGGVVRTHRDESLQYELGPEVLPARDPELAALLGELGLAPRESPPEVARRYVFFDWRLHEVPTSPGALLRSRILSWRAKLRLLGERRRDPTVADDGSIADFARHRFGEQAYERLVDPFVTGLFAGDPEQLSVRACLPELVALVEEHGSVLGGMAARRRAGGAGPAGPLVTVDGGLGEIPRALGDALGERVHAATTVTAVARHADGWSVAADGPGGTRRLTCARLVLATPARVASALLAPVDAGLSAALGSIVSESLVSVAHVWPRERVGHPLDGFGYLVPGAVPRRHLGTLFSSTVGSARAPEGQVVLRTLLGGARDPAIVGLGDHEIWQIVRYEVSNAVGLPGRPTSWAVTRWRDVLPRYDLDHPARGERVDAALATLPGLALVGSHRGGVSVARIVTRARALGRAHAAEAGTLASHG